MERIRQENHYNVKLLKGYGLSIDVKDNRLCPKCGQDPLSGGQEVKGWLVSQIPPEHIIISGKGYLSADAVKLPTDHNINISFSLTPAATLLLQCIRSCPVQRRLTSAI